MIKSKLLVVSLVVLLVLTVINIAAAGGVKKAKKEEIKVGVTIVTLADPFFASLKKGLEERAKEVGNIDLNITDGQGDSAKQFSQVENFIAQGYDAIIINPIEAAPLVPVAKEANEKGIIVITLDRFLDTTYGSDGVVKVHCGADAVDGGRLGIRLVAKKLQDKYGEPKGNVLYIEGTPGSSTARDRTTGVKEELPKYPGIKIIDQQPGEVREKAMALTENWLQMYPNVDAIYAYGDDGALGAVRAAEALGKLDKIIIVGTGASWDAKVSICEDKLDGTVDFSPESTGRDAINVILKLREGESVQEWVRTEAQMVTKETLDCEEVLSQPGP